jgi:glucan phosphoethanolaminetransferase (alkaline phosphatase superfamily)
MALDIWSLLGPEVLRENIPLIAEIMSVMFLVIFDEIVSGKMIFPLVDKIKKIIFKTLRMNIKRKHYFVARYSSEFLATALFILYFVFGYWILSEYFFVPVLARLQNILIIVIIIFFVAMSWALHNKDIRRKYLYG